MTLPSTDLSLVLLHIDLIPQHDKGKILRVVRARLDKELITPAVERLERLSAVHVIHKHTAVCTAVVGHT